MALRPYLSISLPNILPNNFSRITHHFVRYHFINNNPVCQRDSRFYFLYKKKNEKRLFLYSLTAVSIFIRKWKSIVENDGISHCSSVFLGLPQWAAAGTAPKQRTPPGIAAIPGGVPVLLLLQSVQNLNRFTMRSHRRVKKLPSWVVVSATAVFSAAATVSPVL